MKLKEYLPAILILTVVLALCASAIIYAGYERRVAAANAPAPVVPSIVTDFSFLNESEVIYMLESESESISRAEYESVSIEESIAASEAESISIAEYESISQAESESQSRLADELGLTPIPTKSPDGSHINLDNYSFQVVGPEYFDDAIFVGNSRMQGFVLYCGLPNLRAYTSVGMNVSTYFTKADFDGLSAAEAVRRAENVRKIYIKLGINELGWVGTTQYIDKYSEIIEDLQAYQPDAIIYVISVLPFAKEAMEKDATLDMNKVNEYNNGLKEMCDKYRVCYLDVSNVFMGEDGYMPYEFSFDGIHINAQSINLWLSYLLQHAIVK